jgi:UrcA family protein
VARIRKELIMNRAQLRLTVGAAALALAGVLSVASVHAQPAGYYDQGPGYVTTEEGITVYAPRHRERSAIGAPIDTVRESRVVYARDLDLSTDWGARTLRRRIQHAARDACSDLDSRYPITVDAPEDCVNGAVRGAMHEVEYRVGFTPPTWWY